MFGVILIEFISFVVVSIVFEQIRNFKFYNFVISSNKNPLDGWMSCKERLAYQITKFVVFLPTFSFAPSPYSFYDIDEQLATPCNGFEKTVLKVTRLGMRLMNVIGNILFDIVFIITILTCEKIIKWDKLWELFLIYVDQIKQIDFLNCIQKMISWIQNNAGFVVVIVILSLSVYIGILNIKKKKYDIEAVWDENEKEKIKEVANIQKDLEDVLLRIRLPIYQNIKICRSVIRYWRHLDEDQRPMMTGLQDYEAELGKIKDELRKIAVVEGIQIYHKRNKKIYLQLMLLGILPSLSETYSLFELERFTASKLDTDCTTKQNLIETWSYGIATVNGIERFLKFSYMNRKRYKKIVAKISTVSYLEELTEKVK